MHRSLRKTSHILSALASLVRPSSSPPVTYYALDLEQHELVRTLRALNASGVGERICGKIRTRGLCATYDEGIGFIHGGGIYNHDKLNGIPAHSMGSYGPRLPYTNLNRPSCGPICKTGRPSPDSEAPPSEYGQQPPLHILFLGSSLGNFSRGDGAAFLRSLPLRVGCGDTVLLGLDGDNDPAVIDTAYNDARGVTKAFVMNSLRHAGRILGDEEAFAAADGKWTYVSRYDREKRG